MPRKQRASQVSAPVAVAIVVGLALAMFTVTHFAELRDIASGFVIAAR